MPIVQNELTDVGTAIRRFFLRAGLQTGVNNAVRVEVADRVFEHSLPRDSMGTPAITFAIVGGDVNPHYGGQMQKCVVLVRCHGGGEDEEKIGDAKYIWERLYEATYGAKVADGAVETGTGDDGQPNNWSVVYCTLITPPQLLRDPDSKYWFVQGLYEIAMRTQT